MLVTSFSLIAVGLVPYSIVRGFYLLWLHPLAKYSGPKLAAVSNIWYSLHWLSGRYPWAIERQFHVYAGDVVRIAPNELAPRSPQAYRDICGSTQKRQETFIKTDIQDYSDFTGFPNLGVAALRDPKKHAQVARTLQPAFSSHVIQSYHNVIHQVVDEFILQLQRRGEVNITKWAEYLVQDLSGKIVYGREAKLVKTGEPSPYVIASRRLPYLAALLIALKRVPLLKYPLFVCLVPWVLISGIPAVGRTVQEKVRARLAQRDDLSSLRHPDHLQPIISPSRISEEYRSEIYSDDWIIAQANSLMAGALGPVTKVIISAIMLLCSSPEKMEQLKQEVHNAFDTYAHITAEAVQSSCHYLNAVIDEDLRLITPAPFGLPRSSPGTHVDVHFVPAGATVQTCNFATAHYAEYLFLPHEFHPERFFVHGSAILAMSFALINASPP
ncbi:cytochrome P450 [Colletotrichum caudatum]|nr:cytochrome P450 [Colletotrichum caudatum]